MIDIDRKQIEAAKSSLLEALNSAKTMAGHKIADFKPSEASMECAVMTAINIMLNDKQSNWDCAKPSDIHYLTNLGV